MSNIAAVYRVRIGRCGEPFFHSTIMSKPITRFVSLLFVAVLFVGCSGGLETQQIEGTVLFEGSPVADALVGFSPKGGGIPAYGRTDAQGVYKITSAQGGKQDAGAVPGEYIVTISKAVPIREPTAQELIDLREKDIPINIPEKNALPERYGNTTTSEFTATVVKGKNTFDFELTP